MYCHAYMVGTCQITFLVARCHHSNPPLSRIIYHTCEITSLPQLANDLWFSKLGKRYSLFMLQLNLILWTFMFDWHVLITSCFLTRLHDCWAHHTKESRLSNSYVCDADTWMVTNSMEVSTFYLTCKWIWNICELINRTSFLEIATFQYNGTN
jgi:hypothetical protein